MRRLSAPALALVLWLGASTGLPAQEAVGGELSDDQIAERILELRRELDALLAALPPEIREEVERRRADATKGSVPPPLEPEPPESEYPPIEVVRAAPPAPEPEPESEAPAEVDAASEVPATDESPAVEGCAEFAAFDTNGDGAISGFDRYWRLFRLWRDDGDGVVEPPEVVGLYDAGVREFSSALRRYETVDGIRGDVRLVGGWVIFDLVGKKGGSAALLIDAERLSRGGELTLVDSAGEPLAGLHQLGETSMLSADGAVAPLSCS